MNEDKKNQLKRNLEYAKQELEELKSKNPNGNYVELELMIEKMNAIINGEQGESSVKLLFKFFVFIVLAYVVCTLVVAAVFGFSHSLLNPIPPMQYITILPLTSFILFIGLRVLNFISNKALQSPIFSMFLFGILFIIGLAFLDNIWFHLCSSFDKSLLMATVLLFVTSLTDLLVTQKIYLRM